ncbi:hypothetical protein DVH24_013488 [Malus domestica]|uniref:Uncharacterized protein n=1 Tax=Malus domestica TaxID=3750 RepID=A0A498HLG6_MALDO|nr:hypothetical protein DVH24_013488 [Malus domestica]
MVQKQAKKIENLSSMMLYSNRDENRDHFKKETWSCELKNSRQSSNFAFTRFLLFYLEQLEMATQNNNEPREINKAVMYEYQISSSTLRCFGKGLCALHSAAN